MDPQPASETPAPAFEEVLQRLRLILMEQFGKAPDELASETSLRGALMLDSLDLMDLAFYIERAFGVVADSQTLRRVRSLAGLARLVHERWRSAA